MRAGLLVVVCGLHHTRCVVAGRAVVVESRCCFHRGTVRLVVKAGLGVVVVFGLGHTRLVVVRGRFVVVSGRFQRGVGRLVVGKSRLEMDISRFDGSRACTRGD